MENKDCYTLADLKKFVAECNLPDDTPIIIERVAKEDESGGHDVESLAMEFIGDGGLRYISFGAHEDNLSNNDLEYLLGDM